MRASGSYIHGTTQAVCLMRRSFGCEIKFGKREAYVPEKSACPSPKPKKRWARLINGLCFWLSTLFLVNVTHAQQPTPTPPQTIRLNIERVNVGVIVTDSHGKFIEGLRREDFRVTDNGIEQPITEFSSIDDPAQLLLLVEAGPAVYLLQDVHFLAADGLLRGLSQGDRVAIAQYTQAPIPVMDFNADKTAAQAALNEIRFNLGFGQLNLAASLNTVLEWLARVPGKKSIVLLSTGVDTSPPPAIRSLQTRLEAGDVRLLCVSLSAPLRNGKAERKRSVEQVQQSFESADAHLRALAAATGGRTFFPGDAKAFEDTYRQVAELVRHEYSLAFAPPKADGAVHSIAISVKSPNLSNQTKPRDYRVDHRRAYVAPSPPQT